MRDLLLFDVDGTLTPSRQKINESMVEILKKMSKTMDLAFVGGSNYEKQLEQLGDDNINLFIWKFTENGLVSYHNDIILPKSSMLDFLGNENMNNLINLCLQIISETNVPKKRGNFIELRTGMLNISPIGRNCSLEERNEFVLFNQKNKILEQMVEQLKKRYNGPNLAFSIGGQISIDIFPLGWDKTFCLKYIDNLYDKIYFFGDKTFIGGNDYEIFHHPRVIGFTVSNPAETIKILETEFL